MTLASHPYDVLNHRLGHLNVPERSVGAAIVKSTGRESKNIPAKFLHRNDGVLQFSKSITLRAAHNPLIRGGRNVL